MAKLSPLFKYVAPETPLSAWESTANTAAYSEANHYKLRSAALPAWPFCFFSPQVRNKVRKNLGLLPSE